MNTIKKINLLQAGMALAASVTYSAQVFAVAANCNNCQGVSYSAAGNTGSFSVTQNSAIAEFTENVSSASNETYDFSGSQAGQVLLVKDLSGMISRFDGGFTGDGNVRVFFENTSGIVFGAGSSIVNIPSLTATTYTTTGNNGQYEFSNMGGVSEIVVEGLTSTGEVALLANRIRIEGDVDIAENFSAIAAGGTIVASFDSNDLLQFEFDQANAFNPAGNNAVMSVNSSASLEAANVMFKSWITDPARYAIQNRGIIEAVGISVGEGGRIVLDGAGGIVESTGVLDATDQGSKSGDIEIAAVKISLDGELKGGSGNLLLVIGDTGDTAVVSGGVNGNPGTLGVLDIVDATTMEFGVATVQGLGEANVFIRGFANYIVNGLNSGTAAYKGIGTDDWQNVGAVEFFDIGILHGRANLENTFRVESGGVLYQEFSGIAYGNIHGKSLKDTFIIAGEVQNLFGEREADTFIMDGGQVFGLVDGGNSTDTLIDVIDPVFAANGFDGSGANVGSWDNIEIVIEFVPPSPVPVNPSSSIIAPQVSFLNLSNASNNALGLVGDDANPRLPCGFRTEFPTAEEKAAAEEDCLEDYNSPEYQSLLSSIIHFDNDSSKITLASAERLDKVSAFVVESELFETVRISGHTDSNASDAYNMALSERRANSTSAYMQSRGVSADLIRTQFFGERLPAVPNTSPENLAINRRAVIELER